jgi:hypothetical protein
VDEQWLNSIEERCSVAFQYQDPGVFFSHKDWGVWGVQFPIGSLRNQKNKVQQVVQVPREETTDTASIEMQ